MIFAAMGVELRACLPAIGEHEYDEDGRFPVARGERVTVCQTGLGRVSLDAAEALLAEVPASAVLSAGTAGGLGAGVSVGDLVFCESVWHSLEPGSVVGHRGLIDVAMDTARQHGLPAQRGKSVTVDVVAWGPDEKAALHARGKPDIVEMESFWIGQTAARRGLPYMAIRAVSDDATNRITEIPGLFDEQGRVDSSRLLEFTREHPEVIPELAAQHQRGGIALDALTRFMQAFLPRVRESL